MLFYLDARRQKRGIDDNQVGCTLYVMTVAKRYKALCPESSRLKRKLRNYQQFRRELGGIYYPSISRA
jgi:hypothetical protein